MCKARDPFFLVFFGVFFVGFSRCSRFSRYFRCFLYTCVTGERRFATLAANAGNCCTCSANGCYFTLMTLIRKGYIKYISSCYYRHGTSAIFSSKSGLISVNILTLNQQNILTKYVGFKRIIF